MVERLFFKLSREPSKSESGSIVAGVEWRDVNLNPIVGGYYIPIIRIPN